MEKFDIVIIGAGLGGLSVAGYLAKMGKKVLVLEHHSVPGGYAHEFRRGKYRFEVALHAMDGVAPGGWAYATLRDLGVLEKISFHRLDPFYTAHFPDFEITAHADIVQYEAELVKHFPKERRGIHDIIADMLETYWQVRRFGAEGEMGIRPPVEQTPVHYPKMLAAMSMSWAEYMNQFLAEDKLKAALSSLWGYYGLPPENLNAATYIFPWGSYHLSGAFYPEGGSMAISRALESTLKRFGGEIRYQQTVNRIVIRNERAIAVETEKGLHVEADAIVSNANAPDTLLRFVGRQHLPAEYIQKVEADKPSTSNLVVYLGLDCDLRDQGWHHHELFEHPGYDIAQNYSAAMLGNFIKADIAFTYYNIADPNCSPVGASVLNIFTLASWKTGNQWGTGGNLENYSSNPRYNHIKKDAAEVLLDRAEKLIPNLRQHIKYMEIGTPITNWRYSRNMQGSIYGSEQSVENTYLNRLQPETPIPNLFLVGAWTFAGGMSAALLSGRETSKLVIGYLDKREVGLMTMPREVGSERSSMISDQLSENTRQALKSGASQFQVINIQLEPMKAIGSNRAVKLDTIGKPALLLFHTPETAEDAAKVNAAIRSRNQYQSCNSLVIANIVDLHAVPKLFRRFAEKAMKESYEKATLTLPAGAKPEDYVLILPDWDGSVTKAFGLKDTHATAAIVVMDASGGLIGSSQGNEVVSNALELLKKV